MLTSVSWPKSISSHCTLPTEIPQTVSKAEGQVPYIPPWAVGQRCCQNKGKNYSKSGVEMHEFKSEASYLPGAAPPSCAGWGSPFPASNPARGREELPLEQHRELVETLVTAVPSGSRVTPARSHEDVPWGSPGAGCLSPRRAVAPRGCHILRAPTAPTARRPHGAEVPRGRGALAKGKS